eukprot:16451715-Heterocapsa_arctica.AAC.1
MVGTWPRGGASSRLGGRGLGLAAGVVAPGVILFPRGRLLVTDPRGSRRQRFIKMSQRILRMVKAIGFPIFFFLGNGFQATPGRRMELRPVVV